jgi:RNA polymerase sigma-70 factor (ECF subfamily)
VACVPALRAFARSLAGDSSDADDLAQTTLLRALRARRQFTPGTSLKSWLFTILRNQFYNDRRAARRSVALDPEDAERRLVACDDPGAALALNDVRMALMALPPEQREALMLIGGAGLSYEEASIVTGVVVGTVKSRVSRARATLQARLESGQFKRDRLPAQASAAWLTSPLQLSR